MCKINILEVRNLVKEKQPRKKLPEDACCEVCGDTRNDGKLRNFNGYIVFDKHYSQLNKYGRITDITPRQHKKELEVCCICGNLKRATYENKAYCNKHYLQITRHGKILDRTIYDKNDYIEHDDYIEIKLYDKNCEYVGSTKIDKDMLEFVQKYKVYIRKHDGSNKLYAMTSDINNSGKKVYLHRLLMGLKDVRYNLDIAVDHINGDSLDNRLCNLRICKQEENMKNIRKNDKIVGVGWLKANKKWTARIMHNYKGIHLGNYDLYEEAVLARIKKEFELCGEFGPNKDLYYIINHPSPIEELRKVITIPEPPIEGA